MNKTIKAFAIAAIIALLGAGCTKAPSANTPPASGTSSAVPATGTFVVNIQPDGQFDPVTSFVKVGTKVVFKNNSDKPHRIASNDDKSLDNLPPFASTKDIVPGGFFEITMTKAGRQLYNDPLNPAFGGAIMVTE